MNKKYNVQIIIENLQRGKGIETDKTTFQAEAMMVEKDGARYILYEEKDTDTRATIQNRLIIREKQIDLKKKGLVTWEMHFEKNVRSASRYHTPYGVFPISVFTYELVQYERDREFCITLQYRLEIQENVLDCKMHIYIKR